MVTYLRLYSLSHVPFLGQKSHVHLNVLLSKYGTYGQRVKKLLELINLWMKMVSTLQTTTMFPIYYRGHDE